MKSRSRKLNSADKIQKINDQNSWCAALDSTLINDEHWWCLVTMTVETSVDHSCYISLLSEAAERRRQACLYFLTRQRAVATVRELSKQEPEKCPVIQGVCHHANAILSEDNGDLPTTLMAQIIKYLIYRAKVEYFQRLKKLQVNLSCEIDEQYRIIWKTDGSNSLQNAIRSRKVDNSSESEFILNGKARTRLRKRGEESLDVVHVDDVAFDGPSLYVVLSGLHDPDLPAELLNVGVPLTCILEIKLSGEQYTACRETKGKGLTLQKKPYHGGDYCVNENELLQFWTVTHERLDDPSAYPMYSDIAVLAFCPPILPDTFDITEKESLMRDMYDEMFFTLHRLRDLRYMHESYLKSMKLERALVDAKGEIDTKIYESVLNNIPNEYVGVPMILSAILLQVESNVAKSSDECPLVDRNAELNDVDAGYANTATATTRASPACTVRDKLKLLDVKYQLCDEFTDDIGQLSQITDIKLVPYKDTLSVIARCFLKRKSTDVVDAVLRILRDPRVVSVWRDHESPVESKTNVHLCHIDSIARLYDEKQTVSREEAIHYLHLLMFDRLIFSESEHKVEARLTQTLKNELSELKHARTAIRRTHSALNVGPSSLSISSLRRSKSDTEINYGEPVAALAECPLLFALTDIREALHPGYSYKSVVKKRSYDVPTIEEYEDVELLSSRVFLQVVYECFQSFDRLVARYSEPTDSVLLYFSNSNEVGSVSEETRLSTIRTPVRFREFCKYIVHEEENWMKRVQETRESRKVKPAERFMKKSVEVEDDDAIIFDDECFVLPDSLKARRRRVSQNHGMQEKISETRETEGATEVVVRGEKTTGQKRNEAPMVKSESKQASEKVTKGGTSMTEKKLDSKIDGVDTSFLSVEKILSSQCAEEGETYDFVGYDLGSLRVQVNHCSKKFLLHDDTSVRIELEDWLYGDTDLRIAITLQNCTLRLFGGAGCPRLADTFHVTTKSGIVLGFCQNRELAAARNLAFDFRASWPSGLLIKPTVGDGTKNPFCIRQSYVSKCSVRAGAAREVCRNFLRNGTVLKYLDDNTVVILRPNGVIVTCMDLDKPRSRDKSAPRIVVNKELKTGSGNAMQSVTTKRREEVMDFAYSRGSIMDMKRHVLSAKERTVGDDSFITGIFAEDKALRYSVVNYDGRRYEVLNDLVVGEYDRLLVRTTSDYEVNEILVRRADDTDMLFRSNGELIATFSDGTRITTGYAIEEQLVACDWSEDELERYFGFAEADEYGDERVGDASSSDDYPYEDSYSDYREKLTRISIADGFVSISLICRMEHRDYATVSYDQSAVRCTLSMPDDLCVSISRRGHYKVSMGSEVNLKICDDDLVFSKICTTCGGRSMSTYKFCEPSEAGPRTILATVDIAGDVLEVKSDGTTRYHREERRYERDDDVLESGEERRGNGEAANSQASFHCKHERYCEKLKFPVRSQYRIFAMNRDLTACEYLHRSVRREREVAAVFDDETSMIQYPISRRPELGRLITFVPVEPELGSKEISCQYRITPDKWKDYDGIALPRSTYSSPYNWLLPFGRRDRREIAKSVQGDASVEQNEQLSLPELLQVRVFFGIKEEGRSVVTDMQRAMGRHWISVFRDGDKCHLLHATGNGIQGVKNVYEIAQDDLRDLALGIKDSIDIQTYVNGLRGKLIKPMSAEVSPQTSRFAESLRAKCLMEEEYEWYKQCLRERIIVPYFRNIAGSCSLLVKDLVEEAMRASKKYDPCVTEEEDESSDSNIEV